MLIDVLIAAAILQVIVWTLVYLIHRSKGKIEYQVFIPPYFTK